MIREAVAVFLAIHVTLMIVASCDGTVDWFVEGEADYGTVFVCDDACTQPDGTPGYEYCFDGDADELSALMGARCRPIGFRDRLWPALVGCAYDCEGRLHGPGANSHCGSFCR